MPTTNPNFQVLMRTPSDGKYKLPKLTQPQTFKASQNIKLAPLDLMKSSPFFTPQQSKLKNFQISPPKMKLHTKGNTSCVKPLGEQFQLNPSEVPPNHQTTISNNLHQSRTDSIMLVSETVSIKQFSTPPTLPSNSYARPSMISQSDDSEKDEFEVWDNRDLVHRGIDIKELDKLDKTSRMLSLFKMRFSQFPTQKEPIKNVEVIRSVKRIARCNPQLYREYFQNQKVYKPQNHQVLQIKDHHDLSQNQNAEAKQIPFTQYKNSEVRQRLLNDI